MKNAHRPIRRVEIDSGAAFLRDFRRGFVRVEDDDAEAFGEEFVAAVTSNDAVAELARDEVTQDDIVGIA